MLSIPSATKRALDATVKRDVAVLTALAYAGWLTTEQLHRLCFPGYVLATTRITLRAFGEAGWIRQVRWRIAPQSHDHLWIITSKGLEVVGRYHDVRSVKIPYDLRRPSTALEQQEWRIQVAVRHFVTALILAARRSSLLADLAVQLPCWPPLGHVTVPDAVFTIVWRPAVTQGPSWLPWPVTQPPVYQSALQYPLHLDRSLDAHGAIVVLDAATNPAGPSQIPIIVLRSEERRRFVQHRLQSLPAERPVRLGTWEALEGDIEQDGWYDSHGNCCTLQPCPDEMKELGA